MERVWVVGGSVLGRWGTGSCGWGQGRVLGRVLGGRG